MATLRLLGLAALGLVVAVAVPALVGAWLGGWRPRRRVAPLTRSAGVLARLDGQSRR